MFLAQQDNSTLTIITTFKETVLAVVAETYTESSEELLAAECLNFLLSKCSETPWYTQRALFTQGNARNSNSVITA